MKREYSAGLILYRLENNQRLYLLLHYQSGHWDFVKGHIEQGESKEQAALRELQEETGITQVELDKEFEDSFSYFFKSPQGELIHKTVYFLIGKTDQKEITLSHEHIGFAWLPFKEAFNQLTYKNARELLKKADEHGR